MKKELDDQLCEKYPRFYQNRSKHARESCMALGFTCGDGWFGIIEKLTADIEEAVADMPEEDRPVAAQVKEKFGLLRFYLHGGENEGVPEKVRDLVKAASKESETTCEFCGDAGSMRTGGWLKTLCDPCHKEREEKRSRGEWG